MSTVATTRRSSSSWAWWWKIGRKLNKKFSVSEKIDATELTHTHLCWEILNFTFHSFFFFSSNLRRRLMWENRRSGKLLSSVSDEIDRRKIGENFYLCLWKKSKVWKKVMSSIYGMERPGFWRNPKFKNDPSTFQSNKKKVHFYDESVSEKSFFYDLWHIAHLESPLTLVLCLTGVSYFRKLLTNLSTWRRDQQIQLSLWISLQFSCALLPTTKEKFNRSIVMVSRC